MKTLLILAASFLPFIAGCFAFGGDSATPSGMVGLNWQTVLTTYGPMPLVMAALFYLLKERDKQVFGVLDKYNNALEKHNIEMKEMVAAMTQMTATLAQLCVEVEKTRVTAYQLRDMAIKQSDGIWEPDVRGNTRIMRKDG